MTEGTTTYDDTDGNFIVDKDLSFKEITSETVSSTSVLGKRILRQYNSEFILPDETRIAVSRKEATYPSDFLHHVTVSISSGIPNPDDPFYSKFMQLCNQINYDSGTVTTDTCTSTTTAGETTDEEIINSKMVDNNNSPINEKHRDSFGTIQGKESLKSMSNSLVITAGLRISDYIDDDAWAASILECDTSSEGELLRQLEANCRLNPSGYQMERVEKKKNYKTVVDIAGHPYVRTIGLSRTQSEADSVNTTTTEVSAN